MISKLTGKVIENDSQAITLDVNGVGYLINVSTNCSAFLSINDETVSLFTYLHVREGALELFGFLRSEEKQLFEKLISVSGIGPKVALSALSVLTVDNLKEAIVNEDVSVLSKIPKVGQKSAKRIILDLKDKIDYLPQANGSVYIEAREALIGLGYSIDEARQALEGYNENNIDTVEEMVKYALKKIALKTEALKS